MFGRSFPPQIVRTAMLSVPVVAFRSFRKRLTSTLHQRQTLASFPFRAPASLGYHFRMRPLPAALVVLGGLLAAGVAAAQTAAFTDVTPASMNDNGNGQGVAW